MITTIDDRSVLRLVQIALAEDVGSGDVTGESLIGRDRTVSAALKAKQRGVIAGSVIAGLVFGEVDRSIDVEWRVSEGMIVEAGTVIGVVRGSARSIMTAERTALNFLQRMSGVATLTRRYVDAIHGTDAKILDTRKTIPAWRLLDKYAVKIGGGRNHRMGLYDMVMIKDNHIAAHGSISGAILAVRTYFDTHGITGIPIEIETQNIGQVMEVIRIGGVERIMFDNYPIAIIDEAVDIVAGRFETEASGGVNLETVREIAETGVDYISVGAITHSAIALDISLDVEG